MAEWRYEAGIGENRAILVEDDAIIEAWIELPDQIRVGSVVDARLSSILIPGHRAIVTLANSLEILIEPLPANLTEGQAVRVEIVREAIPEAGREKRARGRITDAVIRTGPALIDRIGATGLPIRQSASFFGDDGFEPAGWSELLEQGAMGEIPFDGGALRMSLTPAMTLFDVDGTLPSAPLAVAGAQAAGRAIRRFGITGSIGIDLPTLSARPDRQAAAAALDAVLPQPFERTAVNGFGFLQIVRRRDRASIPELLQGDRVGGAARALLRSAERTGGSGERVIRAHPNVIARLEQNSTWIAELRRRIGASVALHRDAALAISAGHVQSAAP